MRQSCGSIDAVLFDLDGTLLDSAPDLHAALALQCAEEGMRAPDFAAVRPVVSRGARAVLRQGFPRADTAAIEARVPRFLELYRRTMHGNMHLFDGVHALLLELERSGRRWGVVTNKMATLSEAALAGLGLSERVAVVVSGDTLTRRKPDPAPVLHACQQIDVAPQRCLFVGDDERDMQSGAAAGTGTVAVTWGYLDGGDPYTWGADHVIDTPAQLMHVLGSCGTSGGSA